MHNRCMRLESEIGYPYGLNAVDQRMLASPPAARANGEPNHAFETWSSGVRSAVLTSVADFVAARCAADLRGPGADIAGKVVQEFVGGGKCVRSTFALLGWLCGADLEAAALRAAASFELLHAFALLQDDVMDESPVRRGRPSAHVQLARWHRDHGLSGPSSRFGASAAMLLGDLCLVWAEQMLRGSGLGPDALGRAWPRYDAMRTELAVGQFSDIVNDAASLPSLIEVLDVARRKSGNYTVRRPLEIGAALAGCDDHVLTLLGEYGEAVGEAFQMRDDLLGIYGSPQVTGKPTGADLFEHKATTVIAAAHQLADNPLREELSQLMSLPELDPNAVDRCRALITATGAVELIEQMIADRVTAALDVISTGRINQSVRDALANMAVACSQRAA
jgi:geranylgeranyl diphosphate synthase type I